jgi:hypothetical protein
MATKITPTIAKALATEVLNKLKVESVSIKAKKEETVKKSADFKQLEKLVKQYKKIQSDVESKLKSIKDKNPNIYIGFSTSYGTLTVNAINTVPSYESICNKIIVEGFISNGGETADQFVKRIASEITKTL